jgi:hypothetical protein
MSKGFSKSSIRLGGPQAYVFTGIRTVVPLHTSFTKDKSICMVLLGVRMVEKSKFSKCPSSCP